MCQVSVVMTVYNCEKYVRQAVESILSQTFNDFEFVVVDNCSTDSSYDIISAFHDPRLKCIRNEQNLGQTRALNIGIQNSRGKYIARMDADDIAVPERLKKQYEFLEKNPQIAAVGSWCLFIDEQERPLRVFKFPTDPETIRCFLLGSGDLTMWCVGHPTVCMRKSALAEVGFYNDRHSDSNGYPQDYELWGHFSRKYDIANIGEPLLKYRVLLNSESRNFSDKTLQDRYNITAEKARSYFPGLNEGKLGILTRMLEYQPQLSSQDGLEILEIFDGYFEAAAGTRKGSKNLNRLKDKMKFYYLPQLFKTNKMLSLKEFVKFCFLYPYFLFDAKIYRKTAKVFLSSVLKEEHRYFLFRRILLYR